MSGLVCISCFIYSTSIAQGRGPVFISKNNTWRQVRPERLVHLAHITSIANQDATPNSSYHLTHLTQHHIFRASPGATPNRQGLIWRTTIAPEPHLAHRYIFRAKRSSVSPLAASQADLGHNLNN